MYPILIGEKISALRHKIFLLPLLLLWLSRFATIWAQTKLLYEVVLQKNVMIDMRDGTKLATDIYRPGQGGVASDGRFPIILERTPYNKEGGGTSGTPASLQAATVGFFVPRGYVVVIQDVRGRYRSEGHWSPVRDEPQDGYDTAKWLGEQSWSNGSIGTVGISYAGATQHALAIAGAPYVKTMLPVDAMSNLGRYGLRHNGAFELRFFNFIFSMGNAVGTPNLSAAATRAAADPVSSAALVEMGQHVRDYIRNLPLRSGTTPLQFAPDYESWLVEAMSHGDYDEYWKNNGSDIVAHLAEYKDIPIYHVTGWYDSWSTSVANINYVSLRSAKENLQRLMIGPWTHGGEGQSFAGEAQFTPDAALDYNSWRLRWFEHWLNHKDNGVDREAPVHLYVMGGGDGHKTPEGRIFVGGHWRDEKEWPLQRTKPTNFYFHADGNLSPERPVAAPPLTYLFDPQHPVPTLGGNISSQGTLMAQGVADQRCRPDFWLCTDSRPLSARNDVLVFQTSALKEDIEVTGRLRVKLWARSNAPDTDFTAKLIDVYPPSKDFPAGFALNVSDSIVRARYRSGLGRAQLLSPGQVNEFNVELSPTSLVFQRGHRIQVDISSSNFPRFDVNPNTGEPLNNNRRWQVAENSLYVDPQHASQIVLPIISPEVH